MSGPAPGALLISADQIRWTDLMDGAQWAVLSGQLASPGTYYTVRFRTSREIRVAPHWHPEEEQVTVLEGPFSLGIGDIFDARLLQNLPTGSWASVARETRHFAVYGPGAIVQVTGVSPFRIFYVDSAHDSIGDAGQLLNDRLTHSECNRDHIGFT
jgi:hypothetical protein